MADPDRGNPQAREQIDTVTPEAPEHLREQLNRDLAVQGADGRRGSGDAETQDKDGEQDGHANRRPDPAGAPAD